MFKSVNFWHDPHPDALVVGVFADREAPLGSEPEVEAAVQREEFEGKEGQAVWAFPANGPRVLVVGLGERGATSSDGWRKCCLAVLDACHKAKVKNVHVDLKGLVDADSAGYELGWIFGLAEFDVRRFSSTLGGNGKVAISVASLDGEFDKGLQRGGEMARATNLARFCALTPPNIATPEWMGDRAKELARDVSGLTVEVHSGDWLERERMTGLMTVGKASENKPCFIKIVWNPNESTDPPIVLLGKTITYDTGGLSIKSKESMPGMKTDKSGGCAVLGAMKAIATVIKPDVPVVALLVAAENSINENAYRPDDIVTYRNGVSVEVTNTDAEGRLVLADGLCWACEIEKARCIVDIATLTGGVVTAIGSEFAGIFSNNDDLFRALEETARGTRERVWRLPLDEGYRKNMESKCADIVNSVPGGKAHPCMGAAFLSYFVTDGTPWAHIDMAGMTGMHDCMKPLNGHSGFGARLLAEFVGRYSA